MELQLVSKNELYALADESRIAILKKLVQRPHTLSELSMLLSIPKSSLLLHLKSLEASGLAIKKDEGRKWKYYELTNRGKEMVLGKSMLPSILLITSGCVALLSTIGVFVLLGKEISTLAALVDDPSHEFGSFANLFLSILMLGIIATVLLVSSGIALHLDSRKKL